MITGSPTRDMIRPLPFLRHSFPLLRPTGITESDHTFFAIEVEDFAFPIATSAEVDRSNCSRTEIGRVVALLLIARFDDTATVAYGDIYWDDTLAIV